MTTGLLGMLAAQKTAKKSEVPTCDQCGGKMKPSQDGEGRPIWICPLCPEQTKPRLKGGQT
jgi:hypothetical protein